MNALQVFLREPEKNRNLIPACFTQMLSPQTEDALMSKFLVYLHESKLDREPEVITQAVDVLRQAAQKWIRPSQTTLASDIIVDIVGTGGDGHNTFNVSTTAGIVAAGVPGMRVIKHGNKAATSSSGSADILKSYGCNLLLAPTDIPKLTSSFLFLLAPIWHPALANVAAIRKSLPHPTIFNILGPLLNPAPVEARIIGVHSPELGPVFIESFAKLNPQGKCMIVCGAERLDEISPAGETNIWTYSADHGIEHDTLKPADFGISTHSLESVKSGTPAENATLLAKLLNGDLSVGDAVLDYVLLNTAALLTVARVAKDHRDGVRLALESITSGAALQALNTFRDESSKITQ